MAGTTIIAGNAALIAAVLGWSALSPASTDHVVVAVAPWAAEGVAELVVAAAGGRIVQGGGTAIVAASDDADFVARLYAAGAMLVIDAGMAAGCTAG